MIGPTVSTPETWLVWAFLVCFNVVLSERCNGFTFFWAVVSVFAPLLATPVLLYWNTVGR